MVLPVTTAWRVLRLRKEEQPPDVEGKGEYIEEAVGQPTMGCPPACGFGDVLATPHRKNLTMLRTSHKTPGF